MDVQDRDDGYVDVFFEKSDGIAMYGILTRWVGDMLADDIEQSDAVDMVVGVASRLDKGALRCVITQDGAELLRDITVDYADRMALSVETISRSLEEFHQGRSYQESFLMNVSRAHVFWAGRMANQLTLGLEMLNQVTPDQVPDTFPD